MISFIKSWLPGIPDYLTLEGNPLDILLIGLVSSCGVSVLIDLMRVHVFIQALSNDHEGRGKERSRPGGGTKGGLGRTLQFWLLTGILAVVGARVASLVVLEFSLRAVSSWITAGPVSRPSATQQFVVHCQFSLGCALSCSLHFLHEGAPQRLLSLLLAAGLSWLLATLSGRIWQHVVALYPLHSSQQYCGVCIGLLSSSRTLLPLLCRALMVTFGVAAVAGITTINRHFLSAAEALRFWTPLTICYTLLIVYIQEEQHRRPGGENVLQTVVVRLGGLLVLMLTVGYWSDVLHILVCFLGEACCLVPSLDLQNIVSQELAEEASSSPRWSLSENNNLDGHPKLASSEKDA